MLNSFKISKGHNLLIDGVPCLKLNEMTSPELVIYHPLSIDGIKTKLLIKEGDNVKIGTRLFFDKRNPKVFFVSTCSGKVDKIIYGERRSVQSIQINNNHKYESEKLDFDISIDSLLKSGLWTYIRQRPFSKIPLPSSIPKSIFISGLSTQPFAPDLDFLFNNPDNFLQSGIDVLKTLFKCDINLTSSEDSFLKKLNDVNHFTFNNLHPAGNVGVQIHHIDPIENPDDTRWYITVQDLNRIGQYYSLKKYPNYKFTSIGGIGFDKPSYFKHIIGTPISDIIKEKIKSSSRIISGDILSGKEIKIENSINYYDEILTIIKTSNKRDFLGWLSPGFNKYSLTNTFLSKLFKKSTGPLDTKLNGSIRTIIPMGNWDNVLPMNILPEFLIKNILIEDIEMMEKLGIYECSPEDFSLCSFACQSKVEVSSIIEKGLKFIEENG